MIRWSICWSYDRRSMERSYNSRVAVAIVFPLPFLFYCVASFIPKQPFRWLVGTLALSLSPYSMPQSAPYLSLLPRPLPLSHMRSVRCAPSVGCRSCAVQITLSYFAPWHRSPRGSSSSRSLVRAPLPLACDFTLPHLARPAPSRPSDSRACA